MTLLWDLDEKEKYNIMDLINKNKWKKILKKYSARNIDINGNNLLHLACIRGNKKAIDRILKQDPDLFYVANVNGETCSHLLIKNNWFHIFQDTYLEHPDIVTFIDNTGQNITQIAIDKPFILQWLINKIPPIYKDSMNNLNLQGYNLLTQLMKVTTGKDVYYEIIRELLQKGVNVNSGNIPALNYATMNNNIDLTQLLLRYGANPNSKDKTFMTPLIYSINNSNTNMANLLLKRGADINYGGPEGDNLPINIAINKKNKELVDVLIQHKPNMNIRDRKLNTPLHYLSKSFNKENNMWILPSKAYRLFFKGNIDQSNLDGETPRNLLKNSKHEAQFSKLLNSNISINKENKTRILQQSKMINFINRVANNNSNKINKKDGYIIEKYKSTVRKHIIEGKKNNVILPELKKTNYGLFNSDIIHNCVYTIIFLQKYKNLMIPTQSYIEDIVKNNERNLYEYSSFRSEYGLILRDIMSVYNEFMFEFLPHLIIWRDKNINSINKNIKFYTNDLIKSQKIRFIYFKLTLIPHSSGTHANLIIYDKKTNEFIRFEPYGYVDILDETELNETIENLGKELFGNIKYYKPRDYLEEYRFQVVSDDGNEDNKKLGDPNGYCLAWCFWFIELKLENPDKDIKLLVKEAFTEIEKNDKLDKNTKFLDYIRNYSKKIDENKNKIFLESGISESNIYDVSYKSENVQKLGKYLVDELNRIKKSRLE
jgi:ankyrin repeat protein